MDERGRENSGKDERDYLRWATEFLGHLPLGCGGKPCDRCVRLATLLERFHQHPEPEESVGGPRILAAFAALFVTGVAVGVVLAYFLEHLTVGWR